MGLPIWQTKAGDLGVIAEREFYSLKLEAYDQSQPSAAINFSLVAGSLPAGLRILNDGTINGTPDRYLQGVPTDVSSDVVSRFAVRARSTDDIICDRTFTITVTGEDAPKITSFVKNLGFYLDSTYFQYQLMAVDADYGDVVTWKLNSGELPAGVKLSPAGLLSGYLEREDLIDTSESGFDMTPFDMYPWDFFGRSSRAIVTYKFAVEATDGKKYDIREFEINVVNREASQADNQVLTVDLEIQNVFTSDLYIRRNPVLIDPPSDLGVRLHNDYFAYKFNARDFDGDPVTFSIVGLSGSSFDAVAFDSTFFDQGGLGVPPSLTIDPDTGWFYGHIDPQLSTLQEYYFLVQVAKADDATIASEPHLVKITIITELLKQVTWHTPSYLGSVDNGEVSEFRIQASIPDGRPLYYRLNPSDTGKLPQGLRLLEDGNIIGRVGFNAFRLDGNQTTFDGVKTTFDGSYTINVNAYDLSGQINAFHTFTLNVNPRNIRPYENLYLVSRLPLIDRNHVSTLLKNPKVFPYNMIYRPTDPYFGISSDLRFLLAYGLEPKADVYHIAAMATNHYNKNLRFGNIKTARALHDTGEVKYEVVYVEVIDDLENAQGESIPPVYKITNPISNPLTIDDPYVNAGQDVYTTDTAQLRTLYPNSLSNMQSDMHSKIGQSNPDVLPQWMLDKQVDGSITNYIHVCVLAYVMPGYGDRVAFNIHQYMKSSDFNFNNLKFDIDRYVWDINLSKNYNKVTGVFASAAETTFDALSISVGETSFDRGYTRFVGAVDKYQVPDENDKYLKFPKLGAFTQ